MNSKPKMPDARDQDVGRRIRAQRVVRRISQTELANTLGVTYQQVQKYENGLNRVGAGRLARIAEALNVPVSFFFNGDDVRSEAGEDINSAVSFLETAGAVRLARAYAQIEDPQIRRVLVALAEEIASGRRRPLGRRGRKSGRQS
jgi:transcriptional regulator with XRE-family HTH domain